MYVSTGDAYIDFRSEHFVIRFIHQLVIAAMKIRYKIYFVSFMPSNWQSKQVKYLNPQRQCCRYIVKESHTRLVILEL